MAEPYKYDQRVPYFVVHELPAGIGGLVIAAIFAAAMSSFDSGLNCLVTAFTVDRYERVFNPGQSDKRYLWLAKLLTFVAVVSVMDWRQRKGAYDAKHWLRPDRSAFLANAADNFGWDYAEEMIISNPIRGFVIIVAEIFSK